MRLVGVEHLVPSLEVPEPLGASQAEVREGAFLQHTHQPPLYTCSSSVARARVCVCTPDSTRDCNHLMYSNILAAFLHLLPGGIPGIMRGTLGPGCIIPPICIILSKEQIQRVAECIRNPRTSNK